MNNELINENNLVGFLTSQELVTEEEIQSLVESKDFLVSTMTDVPMYRPLPIKLFGVLNENDFPTPLSKYRQCKAEAEVHVNEVIRDIHEYKLLDLTIQRKNNSLEILKGKLFENPDNTELKFDIEELSILISKSLFELKQVEKRMKYRISEIIDWKNISSKLSQNEDFDGLDSNDHYINIIKDKESKKLEETIKEIQHKIVHSSSEKLKEEYNKQIEEEKKSSDNKIQFVKNMIEAFKS